MQNKWRIVLCDILFNYLLIIIEHHGVTYAMLDQYVKYVKYQIQLQLITVTIFWHLLFLFLWAPLKRSIILPSETSLSVYKCRCMSISGIHMHVYMYLYTSMLHVESMFRFFPYQIKQSSSDFNPFPCSGSHHDGDVIWTSWRFLSPRSRT